MNMFLQTDVGLLRRKAIQWLKFVVTVCAV